MKSEKPTLNETIARLADLIKVADITKSPCIASLYTEEAKLLYEEITTFQYLKTKCDFTNYLE